MLERIAVYLEQHQLLVEPGIVVVAVSGGADSLCLLHLLRQLCGPGRRYPAIQLHVAHLNHQLRPEAGAQDAAAVVRLARAWDLPVTIGAIDVTALARSERRSLEEAARIARYRFLREIAPGRLIAVAHHMDDQLETLLLHWLRGGGIASMVGLQPRQQDIIRPLLCVTHAETLAYCAENGLMPLEDASNLDPRFLRNRIRHELIPLLSEMNLGIRETLLRNAEVMHVDLAWLEEQVTHYWPTVINLETHTRIRLSIAALLKLPLSLQRHLLRRATAQLCAGQSPLEVRHYRLLEQLMQREYAGEMLTLHLPQQLHVRRTGDTLEFFSADEDRPLSTAEPQEALLTLPGQVVVPGTSWLAQAAGVPDELFQQVHPALLREDWTTVWRMLPSTRYTVYIDADMLAEGTPTGPPLFVRTRRPGDRIQPLGMAHEKKVQDVLVDKHVPRAERAQVPLFFTPIHCVWIAGVHLDDRVRLTCKTQSIVRLSIIQLTPE